MTEVLSIQGESNTHFGAPLRRSSSSTSYLAIQPPSSYPRSSSNLKSRYAAVGYDTSRLPASLPSSAPSSPRLSVPVFSNQPSYTSTPSSSLSLDEQCNQREEDILFPLYDDEDEMQDATPAPTPESIDGVATASEPSALIDNSNLTPVAGDDTNLKTEPTRHVDYLSHNWKEEDIWASWRHIVARRKAYNNSSRLENASWRTWAKSKNKLKTVSPEALNWMKDHDVTWLYGPLQLGKTRLLETEPTPSATALSRSNSFASKKPILKKRSLSELMLQRSLSSSTLMKQATDALRAQQPEEKFQGRPIFRSRPLSGFVTASEPGTPLLRTNTNLPSTEPSTSTSGVQTPCTRRHIHFNDKVEQCIAINEEVDDHPTYYSAIRDDSDSSEDDMLVMKPVNQPTKAKINSSRNSPRGSFSNDGKTIAMLPSTTLNYRGDTPEPGEQDTRQKQGTWRVGPPLAPSVSQQTLRPTTPSTNFLLDDEDDDATDINWQPSSSRRGSIYPHNQLEMNENDENDDIEGRGMRRTPSGMFMPYDDEEDYINAGLFGKVVDTVNTAKDIAHVIWNVGWRR